MRALLLLAALAALVSASPSRSDPPSSARLARRTLTSSAQPAPAPTSTCGLSKSRHQLYLDARKGTCIAHCPFGHFGCEQTKTCTKCSSVFGAAVKTCDKDGAKSCNTSKNGVAFELVGRQCVCPGGTALSVGACVNASEVSRTTTTSSTSAASTSSAASQTTTTTTTSHACTATSTPSAPTPTIDDGSTPAQTTLAPQDPATSSTPTATSITTSFSNTSTTSSATTTTPSASTTSAAAPSTTPRLVPGWSYQGCWRDLAFDGRVLPNGLTDKADFTVESCLAACVDAGYAICGLEYKGECWGAPGVPRWTEPIDECTLPGKNNPSAICGGNAALTAYVSESIPWVEPVGNEDLVNYGEYEYQGCFSDLVVNRQRVLPHQHSNPEGRIESCLDFCASKGASYCGLEYYGECFYAVPGESLSSASTLRDESMCRFGCRGAPYEDCGGKESLSLWRLGEAAPPAAATTT